MVGEFPADVPATLFVVLHIPSDSPTLLPAILERKGNLPALSPRDQDEFRHGRIYVAPPDHHLLLEGPRVRVFRGPRENRHRPAIAPLFRSAAWSHGRRVIGVVLTGSLDDGTAGLWAVKSCGGIAVVQDPADASYPSMPLSAIRHVDVDHCLPLRDIPKLLVDLTAQPVEPGPWNAPEKIGIETEAAMLQKSIVDMQQLGTPTVLSCPACKGVLWELQEGKLTRYRCHVGHSYLPGSLVADQSERIVDALYTALATMEEKAEMFRRIGHEVGEVLPKERLRYEELADRQDEQAEVLRKLIPRIGIEFLKTSCTSVIAPAAAPASPSPHVPGSPHRSP